jgi:hypothetical protein
LAAFNSSLAPRIFLAGTILRSQPCLRRLITIEVIEIRPLAIWMQPSISDGAVRIADGDELNAAIGAVAVATCSWESGRKLLMRHARFSPQLGENAQLNQSG